MEMSSVEAVARVGQMSKSHVEILNGFILVWNKNKSVVQSKYEWDLSIVHVG